MNSLFAYYSNSISAQVKTVVTQPVFWVMLLLLLGCLVLTYGATAQYRLSSSVINTIRQFGAFLIDTFNSIVQALRSLFGFLDVLRMLFFGHLGRSTLYVLTNYAIIFLSMASFATTLQGLYSLIGWTGVLVSFGIQVLELIATMGIIICWIPPWAKSKENVRYTHISAARDKICKDKAVDDPAKQNENISGMTEAEKRIKPLGKKDRQTFLWGRIRRWTLFGVLFFAYISSVFFSYCYMFDAIVMPGIAYDDYIESIDLVNNITETFEGELTEYRTQLTSSLTRFNSDVATYSGVATQDIGTLDSQISSLEREMVSASSALQAAQTALRGLTPDEPAYDQFYQLYEDARQRYEDVQSRLAGLQTVQSGSLYSLYQQIQLLDQFYANPLYLMEEPAVESGGTTGDSEGAENGETAGMPLEERLNRAFSVVVDQGYAPHADQIVADIDGIRIAFQNYTMLCKYFAAHGNDGLDLTDMDSGMGVTSLLANRAEILDKYVALAKTPADTAEGTTEETAVQPQQSAGDYLNEETGTLLIAAMRALEGVPRFSAVGETWPALTIREPGIADHLQRLNEKYRAASGQLSLQERAMAKFRTSHVMTARLSMLIALFLDDMIIFLCFLRGREYYANNVRNRRQVVSLLFIIPSTKEEQDRSERSRRLVLMGAVLGCQVYLLYYRFRPNAKQYDLLLAFLLVVAGILLMALLGTLHAALPRKADCNDTDHKDADHNSCLGKEEKSTIEERLYPVIYELLMKKMQKDWFFRCCTALQLKHEAVVQASKNYQQEIGLWRQQEDHKIRTHVFERNDYKYIVTSVDKRMECYIMDDDIREAGLTFQFSVLQSHRLAYPVMAPPAQGPNTAADERDDTSPGDGAEPSAGLKPAYLLTGEFIRLLYECVMLRAIAGDGVEFSMADDLLDYEREDDDDEG